MRTHSKFPLLGAGVLTCVLAASGCSGTEGESREGDGDEGSVAQSSQRLDGSKRPSVARPLDKHASGDALKRVVVALAGDFAFEAQLTPAERLAQRERIRLAQDRVIAAIGAAPGKAPATSRARITQRYTTVPGIAFDLTADAYAKLQGHPDVARILDDHLYAPALDQTTGRTLTDARRTNLAIQGPRGKGRVVAVLDSGVDRNHPFLGTNRFVGSACFSSGAWFSSDEVTVCPNGEDRQLGSSAGENCSSAVSGCDHGTHVAGIVGGFLDQNGNGLLDRDDEAGVAPEVSFVTIQVFHRENRQDVCGDNPAPCTLANTSDIIAGLDHVEALKADDDLDIVAANMSLGGGAFTDIGQCDSVNWLTKWAIDDLRAFQIATVVASGNSATSSSGAFVPGIASPACISTAISVGRTTDADVVFSTSQAGPSLSLLAPGSSVESSVPGTGFANKSGTSMAAPHVAGAWALMRELAAERGTASDVTTIRNDLRATGRPVSDARSGTTLTFRTIDVLAASRLPVVEVDGPNSRVTGNMEMLIPYTLDRNNFGGSLNITASIEGGAPSGLTLQAEPAAVTGTTFNVRVTRTPAVAGTFTLRVGGIANGVRVFEKRTSLDLIAPLPTLTSFSPASGPVTTPVVINGSNFSTLTRVRFAGSATLVVPQVLSSTQISARVPADATSGTIRVENAPDRFDTSAGSFTVTLAPVITSVGPSFAPAGTFVGVNGANFEPSSIVKLGAVSVENLQVVSATRLTFTVPASATSGPLKVTTSGGMASASFTVGYPVPAITSFTPTAGSSGMTVTINGSGFFDTSMVTFGLRRATITSETPNRLKVLVPSGISDTSVIRVHTPGGSASSSQPFVTNQ